MSELSKQALKVDNNQSFPNNNSGAITPAILRSFNEDMIDSTVNQTQYTTDSGSWVSEIDALQAFSASQYNINQTLATTGSNTFNGNQIISGSVTSTSTIYTNDIDTRSGNTLTISSDLDISGSVVANLQAGYVWLGSSGGRAIAVPSSSIAAGGSTDLGPLNAFTASQQTYNTNNNTKWSTLGSQSGSWVTASQTGSFATTGSNNFNGNQTITGSLVVTGDITANKLNVIIESSSVIFSSGSNILGDALNDTQTLIGTTRASGSVQITGSLNQSGGNSQFNSNLTVSGAHLYINGVGDDAIQVTNGNINTNGALIAGTGVNSSGQVNILGGAGLTIAANLNGSGSAYSIASAVVDTTDPTNVYSAFQLTEPNGNNLISIAANSYTGEYPNTTIPILFGGGNNPSGSNAGIAFPSNGEADHWKKSNFKFGVDVTGSLKVSGSATVNGSSVITSNQTGSLVNTSLNAFTASQQALNATFATTGSNTFSSNQYIDGSLTLYEPGNPLIYTNILQDVLSGQLRFNQTAGNGFWLGSNTQINGNLTNNGNIEIVAPYGSITMKANAQGSGSAYTGVNTFVDVTSDPTNVYSAFQLIDDATTNTLIAVALNSYTSQYPGVTIPIIFGGGNNPDANNAGIAFPTSGDMDVWKRTTFAYGTEITGSVRGNVKTQSITSNTASLDFSTSNFFEVTLAASATTRITATNVKPGQTINLKVKQGATTGSISFDSKFKFPAVSPYTASAAANAVDIVTFVTFSDTGSIYSAAVKNMI